MWSIMDDLFLELIVAFLLVDLGKFAKVESFYDLVLQFRIVTNLQNFGPS